MLDHGISALSTRRPNPSSSFPRLQGSSCNDTLSSITQPSPTINLTDEYTLAIQTSSYREIWSKIHPNDPSYEYPGIGQGEALDEQQLLAQVLNPSRESVQEALRVARASKLNRLVSAYFDHSESTTHLCLVLHDSIHRAHSLYHGLNNLLHVLPLDFGPNLLTQSQCDQAFEVFQQFDCLDNPLPSPESHFHDMRHRLSQLNQQLHRQLCKSRSRVRLLRRATSCSATCLIGTAFGVSFFIVPIASLIALSAGPLLPALLPSKTTKKEIAHLAQLDAAAKGTYILHNDLKTIDRLVERLYTDVESDKFLIHLGLERGRDRHSIHEFAKRLQKNHRNFLSHLMDLEEHICLCFAAINRARSLLLEEVHLHPTYHP